MRRVAVLFALVCLSSQACSPQEEVAAEAQAAETQEVPPEMPTLSAPNLVINPKQAQKENETVIVTVCEIFAITPPDTLFKWEITFADSVIESLTPKEWMDNPGEQGWLFQASAVGTTEIRLTSVTPACNSPLPCPPAPPQIITFTLEVK